jgi:hypothetical protein
VAGSQVGWVSHPSWSLVAFQSNYKSFSNPALEFVAAPALAPAEVSVDPALMEQYNRELAQVRLSLLGPNSLSDEIFNRPRQFPFRKKMTTCNSSLLCITLIHNDTDSVLFYTILFPFLSYGFYVFQAMGLAYVCPSHIVRLRPW